MADLDKPVEFFGALADLGDMSKVETKYPVLAPGLYEMKIKGFKKSDKPNSKTGAPQSMLLMELATTESSQPNRQPDDGDITIAPGHEITERIILTPVGGLTLDMIKQKLARVMDAALGSHDGAFDTNELVGKTVQVQVAVRPEREEAGKTYDESNEIKKFIPKSV